MASLVRIINRGINDNKIMLNLTKVSSFDLEDKTITFHFSNQNKGIVGSFLFVSGGQSYSQGVNYDSKEEAAEDFNNICDTLNKYYSK